MKRFISFPPIRCRLFFPVGVAGFLSLSACTVGPDYVRPDAPVPPSYKEAGGRTADGSVDHPGATGSIGWKYAEPQDEHPRGPWWEMFADPELNALVEQVRISNQNIRIAEAQYRQALALVQSARSSYFPTVGASLGVTRGDSGGGGSINRGVLTTRSNVDLSFSWEIDLWGRVRRSVESGQAQADASAVDLAAAQLSAQSALVLNYFQLRVLDAQKDLLERSVIEYEKSLQLTRNQYAAGVAQRSDVAQAETQLQSTRAQALDTGVQRAQLEHAIALLIGKAPADFSLDPRAGFSVQLPLVPLTVPSLLLERRPDIAAAERRMAAANAQIGVAQAAYFPTLGLSAGGGFQGNDTGNLLSMPVRSWSIAPLLALTLFDGGARRAQSDQAIAVYDQNVAAYRQTVLTGLGEVEDNLVALNILAREAEVQRMAVNSARETANLVNNQYKAGTVSYLNVVSAQNAALGNERTALQIAGRQYDASVSLIKALGGGWTVEKIAGGAGNEEKLVQDE